MGFEVGHNVHAWSRNLLLRLARGTVDSLLLHGWFTLRSHGAHDRDSAVSSGSCGIWSPLFSFLGRLLACIGAGLLVGVLEIIFDLFEALLLCITTLLCLAKGSTWSTHRVILHVVVDSQWNRLHQNLALSAWLNTAGISLLLRGVFRRILRSWLARGLLCFRGIAQILDFLQPLTFCLLLLQNLGAATGSHCNGRTVGAVISVSVLSWV